MRPTKLKKMKLNSVDFVRRGANPEAYISLKKSADTTEDESQSFFKSLADTVANAIKKAFNEEDGTAEYMDVAKAEQDLTMFTDVLGESFSSIMKDDTLSQEEKIGMVQKSISEFNDTLGDYLSSFDIDTINKAFLEEGDDAMKITMENVDKSLLSPTEAEQLDTLLEKALVTKVDDVKAGKVDPAAAQEELEDENPELKKSMDIIKALQAETAALKKSIEMKELEEVAKKYAVLGKDPEEVAKTLYAMKSAGEEVYKSYTGTLDEQLELVNKSGLFTEIGKSGNGISSVGIAKGDAETQVETIAKSYMEADPALDYNSAVAKAWENNPQLMAAYEQEAGF